MEVRAFRGVDHDDVVDLWRRVFPDAPPRNDPILDIRRKLAVQPELFLVALVAAKVVGTCMAGFDGHRGWLHLVAVAPELRRKGVGTALLRRAEAVLTRMGCPKLNLQIRATAPEAVGFYEKLGYRVEERISMGKLLPPGRPGG
jgi:ribosomal protein S18 acetylase RimI-like enzyme